MTIKIGDFVYVHENNNITYGRVTRIILCETIGKNYQVDAIDDLYFNLQENNLFTDKESFFKSINKYLTGE